jgi:hypothetical protein
VEEDLELKLEHHGTSKKNAKNETISNYNMSNHIIQNHLEK